MKARFTVEPNGCGGWQCWDNKPQPAKLVTYSAFRRFCDQAKDRLDSAGKDDPDGWRAYYGVTL